MHMHWRALPGALHANSPIFFFFFLLTRPPPRSTLFPYTTLFRSFNLLRCGALLLHFELIDFGAQHAHGAFAILMLRSFVLAGYLDSSRNMGKLHSGISGVHELTALAARTIGVYPKVLRLNDEFDAVVNFRRLKHARDRRVSVSRRSTKSRRESISRRRSASTFSPSRASSK